MKARTQGIRCKKLRPETIKYIHTAIRAFKTFVGPPYDSLFADAIDADLLQSFVDSEGGRITIEVANARLEVINHILEFGVKRKCLLRNPASTVERVYVADVDDDDDEGLLGWPCPTPEEVRLILASAKPVLIASEDIIAVRYPLGVTQ